jgi:L-lysine 6-transaminase
VENARVVGEHLLKGLNSLEKEFPRLVDNTRGRGLFCAMDIATAQERDQLKTKAYEEGLILIGCGDRSIRFRPPLNLTKDEVNEGMTIMRKALQEISVGE